MKLFKSTYTLSGVLIAYCLLLLFSTLVPAVAHADAYTDVARDSTFQFVSRPASEDDVSAMNSRSITRPGGGEIQEGDIILAIEMTTQGQILQTFYAQNTLGSVGFVARGMPSFANITAPNLDDRTFTFRSSGGDTVDVEVAQVDVARTFYEDDRNAGDNDRNVPGNTNPLAADDDSDDPATPDDCRDTLGGAIAWAVCAGIEWVDSSINELLQTLNNLLSVNRSEVETAEMRKAWSFFRNIASLLLVVIGLIMIIGQAVSKE